MKISEAIAEMQLLYLKHGDIEIKHPIDWDIGFSEVNQLETILENDELICYFE